MYHEMKQAMKRIIGLIFLNRFHALAWYDISRGSPFCRCLLVAGLHDLVTFTQYCRIGVDKQLRAAKRACMRIRPLAGTVAASGIEAHMRPSSEVQKLYDCSYRLGCYLN